MQKFGHVELFSIVWCVLRNVSVLSCARNCPVVCCVEVSYARLVLLDYLCVAYKYNIFYVAVPLFRNAQQCEHVWINRNKL